MTTTKLRSLLVKDSIFHWTEAHQQEFNSVKETLNSLEFLRLYCRGNEMYALTDASLSGLGFVLLQKDGNGKSSILQVGSTGLKHVLQPFKAETPRTGLSVPLSSLQPMD